MPASIPAEAYAEAGATLGGPWAAEALVKVHESGICCDRPAAMPSL